MMQKNKEILSSLLEGPILLDPANFTPLTRTPWAGEEIFRRYKKHFNIAGLPTKIGESWEFSCDPSFLSRLSDNYELGRTVTLKEIVESFPEEILSPGGLAQNKNSCEILVKILNAASSLSFQVHPEDNDPNLKKDECGKPESWYIIDAEPNAGIYLGFSTAISPSELRSHLSKGQGIEKIFNFVQVKKGDYFEIAPGLPHAIGPGIVLLEPQRVLPGKTGKTYRLWDWGRKYNDHGEIDQLNGKERELHLEESLRLLDPLRQSGEAFNRAIRKVPEVLKIGKSEVMIFPKNTHYQLQIVRFRNKNGLCLSLRDGYAALTVLRGRVRICGKNEVPEVFETGNSGLLPASGDRFVCNSLDPVVEVALVLPSSADCNWESQVP